MSRLDADQHLGYLGGVQLHEYRAGPLGRAPKAEFYAKGAEDKCYSWGQHSSLKPHGADYCGREMPYWLDCARQQVEKKLGVESNHATVTRYADGAKNHAPPHLDKLDKDPTSVVLTYCAGRPRRFELREKTETETAEGKVKSAPGEVVWSEGLAHGSALVVDGETNAGFYHAVPKDKTWRDDSPCYSLVFRRITEEVEVFPREELLQRVQVAKELCRLKLGKTHLPDCLDVDAFKAFCDDWHHLPHLCVLAHNLHEPKDMEAFGTALFVAQQENQGLKDRETVDTALREVCGDATSRGKIDNGLLPNSLQGNVHMGAANMYAKNKKDEYRQGWTTGADRFADLLEAGDLLASLGGTCTDCAGWTKALSRIQALLPGAGDYLARHLVRSWCVARRIRVPDGWRGFDDMSDGVATFIRSMAKEGWSLRRMRTELGCAQVLGVSATLNVTLVACEVTSLCSAVVERGVSLEELLKWLEGQTEEGVQAAVDARLPLEAPRLRSFGAADAHEHMRWGGNPPPKKQKQKQKQKQKKQKKTREVWGNEDRALHRTAQETQSDADELPDACSQEAEAQDAAADARGASSEYVDDEAAESDSGGEDEEEYVDDEQESDVEPAKRSLRKRKRVVESDSDSDSSSSSKRVAESDSDSDSSSSSSSSSSSDSESE